MNTEFGTGSSAAAAQKHGSTWPIARLLLLIVALAAFMPAAALCQGGVGAWGMGGTGTASARGIDAVSWNPANLAFGNGVTVDMLGLVASIDNNAFSLNRYNEIMGATLSDADKNQILSDIPAGGLELGTEMNAGALGVQIGRYAVTTGVYAAARGRLDRDFVDLVLFGNEVGETVSFDDTDGEGASWGRLTLSTGRPVYTGFRSRISAGVNVHYLQGIYEAHVEESVGELTTGFDGISGLAQTSLVTAAGGKGYAVDLGLTVQAPRGWTFGLAVDNVFGKINWNRDAERRIYSVAVDSLNMANDDMDAATTDSDTTFAIDSYTTAPPSRLRVGAANRYGKLRFALDLSTALDDHAGAGSALAAAGGAELRLTGWFLPRIGLRITDDIGPIATAGLGLRAGPWQLNLAAVNRGGITGGGAKGLGFAVGTRLVF